MSESFPELPNDTSPRPPRNQRRMLLSLALAVVGLLVLFCVSIVVVARLLFASNVLPEIEQLSPIEVEITPAPGETPRAVPTSSPVSGGPAPTAGAPDGDADVPPPPESPRADDTPPQLGLVLIEADFDAPTTRWDQSRSRVVDGVYEMRVDIPNFDNYGLFLSSMAIRDFDMAVDARQVGGDPTAEYGIRFRQSGPGDYLMFSISGSGYYRLVRVTDDVYRSVVPWTFDSRIKTGADVTNRLRVEASGSSIRASINGAQVIDTTDEVAASGQLTLGVTTFDQGDLVVQFDNVAGQAEGEPLDEDFSDPENVLWSIGGATIRNGAYEIFAGGGIRSWQQPLPPGSSEVADFVLEVDATLITGAGEGVSYGVMFGDGGAFDFYSLVILPDGGVALLYSDGAGNTLPLIEPGRFKAVNPGTGATNRIRVEVRNNVISIAVNDSTLPEITSPVPIEGMAGMIVSSGVSGGVQVSFDNFRLEELPTGEQQF